jgi:6-phosphogluconate dehydrogenase
MADHDNHKKCNIGLIGLGGMGRNFAQNMADHGFSVAGYDRDKEKNQALMTEKTKQEDLRAAHDIKEFIGLFSRPRSVMMLVPAGDPVDAVIDELLLYLDSGNSRFTDTNRRIRSIESKGFQYLGMGMSGGESGARRGPSLMPGGTRKGYERIAEILEAAAARVDAAGTFHTRWGKQ